MSVKSFLQKEVRKIRIIKMIIGILLAIMILTDVVLVILEKNDYPTFSWVVRDHRTQLAWFSFLYGGLVAKIFYNRSVPLKGSEVSGFLAFVCMLVLLFVLCHLIPVPLGTEHELLLLVCGAVLAYRAWPQYMD